MWLSCPFAENSAEFIVKHVMIMSIIYHLTLIHIDPYIALFHYAYISQEVAAYPNKIG